MLRGLSQRTNRAQAVLIFMLSKRAFAFVLLAAVIYHWLTLPSTKDLLLGPGELVYRPIFFALPDPVLQRYQAAKASAASSNNVSLSNLQWCLHVKRQDFSSMIPGNASTYVYHTEHSYIQQYAESYFAVTMKKAGWDCLRHYEILAAGAIPFFYDLDDLPKHTMLSFPVEQVKKAMNLPGVPSDDQVRQGQFALDHTKFNQTEYCEIVAELADYTSMYLVTTTLGRYILREIHALHPHLRGNTSMLFVSNTRTEYMSTFAYLGLYQLLGDGSMSALSGRKECLFKAEGVTCYGKGYSYQNVVSNEESELTSGMSEEQADNFLAELTKTRMDEGYFNLIYITNLSNRGCSLTKAPYISLASTLNKYLKKNPETVVVVADGNDLDGCHKFDTSKLIKQPSLQFVRETDNTVNGRKVSLRRDWDIASLSTSEPDEGFLL